jgi:hypothetical protein
MFSRTSARILLVSAASAVALTAGCSTPAHRVEGNERITTIQGVDVQDWESAAGEMSQSLVSSGVLERAPRRPAVLAMSRIINNTTQHVDTDLLTKKIRVVLLNSGKVVTTTTFGKDAEDAKAASAKAASEFFINQQNKAPELPDYSLSGKIIQVSARAGDIRQSTFVFQLSLTEVTTGHAVWEDEKQITKQGSKAGVGY